MNRALAAFGTAALLGSSLLLAAAPSQAADCPAGQHWNAMGGGSGFCSPDASGGGTGGNGIYTAPGGGAVPAPQAPDFQNPNPYQAPVYGNAPAPVMQPPAAPAPVVQAPVAGNRSGNVPAAPRVPNWSSAGNTGAAPSRQSLQSVTPVTGQMPVENQVPTGSVEAAAPAAEAPAVAPAVVLPTTEVQAVDALRSATATPAEKDAAMNIVKAKIDAVLDKAMASH